MRMNLSVLSVFLFFSLFVGNVNAQSVAAPLLKEKVGTFFDGNVDQTIDQGVLEDILNVKVYNFFRNLNPQDISFQQTQIRYFLNRGWQLYAEGLMDGQDIIFIKDLSLENDEFFMVEIGYEEACISNSCDDMQFIDPKDGGCICNTSGDVEYFFRSSLR